jgi:NAD(P)-dependent dehydrogenase (short-subunit alcohol dehydrogenase family)
LSKNNKWTMEKISVQKGKIAIVTGSSSGIGYETARVLANKNAKVIIAVRNLEKGKVAEEKIRAQYKDADITVMELDLANLKSVRTFAENYKKQYKQLDLLINNAGVMMPPYSKTEDGFELQFGTNHLGHFALTGLLFDLIKNTLNSRIVNVSSAAHKYGNLNLQDLNWEKRKYKPMNSYGDSKIANMYFTYKLGRKLEQNGKNPIVAAAHPGWTATELQRHAGLFNFLNNFFAQDTTMGALPTLLAAVGDDVKSGDYFGPSGFMEMRGYPKKVESNELSKNEEIAQKLWDVSEELTGVRFKI